MGLQHQFKVQIATHCYFSSNNISNSCYF